ncbi:hypothetical protein LCM10_16115 [Rossellomorea aquimaris]|uniref:hypothetical protein n=1 Tax=Rossellomorea aquimaris TaxID=189382 RepID=UPI001CD7A4AC|nr:hypothetical protein [Rossellomorea aquimaris]MCA1056527.1 hypothetical protein [Rossellomorea aquimaris]
MNKTVYFLSSCGQRGLMAEGWAGKLPLSNWTFRSAGLSEAADQRLPVLAMKELSIDISFFPLLRIQHSDLIKADVIVKIRDTEYEEDIPLPLELERKSIHWDLPNPGKRSKDCLEEWIIYQEICDELALKVKSLEPLLLGFR